MKTTTRKKILISLMTAFILVWFCCITNAKSSSDLLRIDFGSVKASEPVHRIQMFAIPKNGTNPEGVSVETAGLINYQNNAIISPKRMTLFVMNKVIPVSASPLTVDLNGEADNQPLDIKIDLDLEPLDSPGDYQGVIQFRFWEMNQNQVRWLDPIQVTLKVKVEPWIRLKADVAYIKLLPEQIRNRKNFETTEPLMIQVASNSDWQLGINITFAQMPANNKNITLSVNTKDGSNKFHGINQSSVTTQDGKKVIATGSATVSDKNYWCDIPVNIYMLEYSNYKAGSYYLNVNFYGEVLKQ